MSDRSYLPRVLGLSLGPRVVTSVLTLVTFPILLRSVGAEEYGIIVYLSAVISVFESLSDFGVSSAAGKASAETRAKRPGALAAEVSSWARFQTLVAVLGAAPLVALTFAYVQLDSDVPINPVIVLMLIGGTWATIATNFARACLRSCLEFKSLMVVDTLESVSRSLTWLAAAHYLPNALGIAAAGLASAIITALASAAVLVRALRQPTASSAIVGGGAGEARFFTWRDRLRESLHFLGLRFSTRLTQSLPIVVIGYTVGPHVVGVIGAFAKIGELIGFPFAVVGAALSVRAQEVLQKYPSAVVALWDTVLRLEVLAVVVAVTVGLGAAALSELLLPGDAAAVPQIALLSITIATTAAAALISPMADYIGALPKRVLLITVMAVVQLPLLYLGALWFGGTGAVAAYVLALTLTSAGYVIIAKRAFFGTTIYMPSSDILRFFFIVLGALAFVAIATQLNTIPGLSAIERGILHAMVFLTAIGAAVWSTRSVRQTLSPAVLFDFTRERDRLNAT